MKKVSEPLYLSAAEAAGELSISPATLYAYVSRGLVRSEPVADSRAKRYRADDVRALKGKRGAGTRGSDEGDLPALDSSISTITEEGPVYRGVKAVSLARTATLEQAATLLWDANETDPFAPDNLPVVSPAMRAVAEATREEAPLSRAIAVLSLASSADPRGFNRSREGRARIGARVMRLAASAVLGTEPSAAPLHRQVAAAWASGNGAAEALVRRALVLLADHELNPSTFALRCAVSTGISLYDATVAGLTALKGPRHGGAGVLAAHMVTELAEGDLAARVRERAALGETVPGFGHSVYSHGDARAEDLLAALARAGFDLRLSVEAPALVREATGLHPNIDYALAVLVRGLGLPAGHELALFAVARTAGWMAHGMEQLQSGRLIRPRARYTGPAPARGA